MLVESSANCVHCVYENDGVLLDELCVMLVKLTNFHVQV